jgi:hypothetical protein
MAGRGRGRDGCPVAGFVSGWGHSGTVCRCFGARTGTRDARRWALSATRIKVTGYGGGGCVDDVLVWALATAANAKGGEFVPGMIKIEIAAGSVSGM